MMSQTIPLVSHLLQSVRRLRRAGQFRAARTVLHRLDRLPLTDKQAARVKALLAEELLRQNRLVKARRLLAQALALRPECPRIHSLLGRAWAEDPAVARGHYLRSLELSPAQPRYLAEAGLAAVRMGMAEEGVAQLREAVTQMPLNSRLVARLVQGLCEAGWPDEAWAAVHAARFLAPRCPRLQSLLFRLETADLRRRQEVPAHPEAGPVLLPFVRLEGGRPCVRRDRPVVLPGPHALLGRLRCLRKPS